MEEKKKQYWKGLEQLTNDPEFVKHADKEFPEYLPINGEDSGDGSSRRDFLKLMGFGMAAVTLASCEAPIRKAIPYVNKPVDVDPGVANYYASTYLNGGEYCSVVVKAREGRPIKIEGNRLSKVSQGGTSAQVEASVLSLYDKVRLKGPQKSGADITWADLDKAVKAGLSAAAQKGQAIRILSNTVMSPSTLKVIADFKEKYANTELIQYDTQSAYGLTKAHGEAFGKAVVPSFKFEKADVIVSLSADFLGTWISPTEYTKGYSKTRKLGSGKKKMSRHYQFEANLSLTGANADYRTPIKPSQEGAVAIALYNAVTGSSLAGGSDIPNVKKAAKDLTKSKGKSLVVSASNDPAVQTLIVGINEALGNYGATIDIEKHSNARKGNDEAMAQFVADAKSGKVGAAIFLNCNPVYNHPLGGEIKEALGKVALSVSTADRIDETTAATAYSAPTNHFLEAWNDAEPVKGSFSLAQPTISPIFDTRQEQDSLLTWTGSNTSYLDVIKTYWQENFSGGLSGLDFQNFWNKALQDGVFEQKVIADVADASDESESNGADLDINTAASKIASNYKGAGVELSLYFKVAIGDGSQGNNPWLHETPDPITKVTWDNYLTIAMADAAEWGISEFEGKANKVKLTVNGTSLELPVVIQPGQTRGTVGLALGFGRSNAGRVADGLGVNAFPLAGSLNGGIAYNVISDVSVESIDDLYQVAKTQTHQTYMDRGNVVQEATLAEYQKDPSAGREKPMIATWKSETGKVAPGAVSLWKGHQYKDHHWGMAIDMNSCTGCSACHVSCQAENNIPVVGRQEVINRRDMHWMRIDRYYSSDADVNDNAGLEIAAENPEVTFQPMMCQHCNNAGCETVCPVAATTHSTSGLNQMVYNRCIGTRYCANNCAYKVRRFNWFKYHDNKQFDMNLSMSNDLGKMVLNPDVTVRSRGVMEKCSMCVQRIQTGKLEAKKEGRRTNDEDVNTACASACPSDAIVFGDLNDANSAISKLLKIKDVEMKRDENGKLVSNIDKTMGEERAYTVLEEVGTKPNIMYLTKIRNKDKEESKA